MVNHSDRVRAGPNSHRVRAVPKSHRVRAVPKRGGTPVKELEGRVAVVTGGASGIGRGMVEAFVAQGMNVVLADVERPALDKAVEELRASGAQVAGVECDVSKPESVDHAASAALDAFGAVHVLCNNAGVAGGGPVATWEASLDDWSWVMGVNLWGVVHGIRSFMPILLEQPEGGHIVNTASMAGLIGGAGIYGVTKHAVVALSESLWSELAQRGAKVGVSVLCPGWVNTRIMESERNRPEAPRQAPGADAPQLEAMRQMVEGLIKGGLDPRKVGQIVVEAIQSDRFYVLTHPWQNMIEARMQNILQDRDPVGVPPAGEDFPEGFGVGRRED
jgi:NAD(P)-dependent dehydrogenase (short-subunit alcohol dehydrogenase family)